MKRKPTSPGEILNEEFLKPLGISQKELANQLDFNCIALGRVIDEKSSITSELAKKLAEAFQTTPDFWLNAQMAVDQWRPKC